MERRIFERLEAEDPSAIDHALISGALEPVDFTTPVEDPLCMIPHQAIAGEISEQVVEMAAIRLAIIQAECSSGVAV